MSSLGLITSGYGYLNGLSGCCAGYGGYGYYGGWGGNVSSANAEQTKERIADNYDVYATSQSYRSKSGVETINYNQQCQLLANELKTGEIDQASERFEDIVKQMKNSAQYSSYSDDEIRALIRNQYATTTGADLVSDIKKNSSTPFAQGLKRGIPIFGLLAQKNSEADIISQVTSSSKSKGEKCQKTLGMVTGAAAGTGALAAGGVALYKSSKTGIVKTALDKIPKGSTAFKVGAAITVGAAIIAGIASLFGNGENKTKMPE